MDKKRCDVYDERLEELKNDLHCSLFHQTDENAKIIVEEYHDQYPIMREWIDENKEKLIYIDDE